MSIVLPEPSSDVHTSSEATGQIDPQLLTAQTQQAPTEDEDELLAEDDGYRSFLMFNAMPAGMISMVLHIVLVLLLGMVSLSERPPPTATVLSVSNTKEDVAEVEEFEVTEVLDPVDITSNVTNTSPVMQVLSAEMPTEVTNVSAATDIDAAPLAIELTDFAEQTAPKNDLMKSIGAVAGTGLDGRGSANRAKMVTSAGGTTGSEKAVALALKWLAEHQLSDGSWNFDHRAGLCQGRCSHNGTLNDCSTGATAMALLPFLGAGQTHKEGQYKANVGAGLAYLVRTMKPNGSLMQGGGSMYAHGLGAITLCEAYGMTHDKQLHAPAQASLAFIAYAQDPVGGGWRYAPKQPGDTSAVGWQLMALKSGHMSYLTVPPATVQGAIRFLDSVQANGGANYGYTGPGAGPATSAVGLLCRMYLGWKKNNSGLQKGVEYLSNTGPSKSNMYFNYYATQVLRHWEGDEWKKWNEVMREQLVTTQSQEGHMTGSWFMEGNDHGAERGGRLYCTSMATMILEVYYRHMPIYAKAASEEDFPLK
jgi:hypothetical protein